MDLIFCRNVLMYFSAEMAKLSLLGIDISGRISELPSIISGDRVCIQQPIASPGHRLRKLRRHIEGIADRPSEDVRRHRVTSPKAKFSISKGLIILRE